VKGGAAATDNNYKGFIGGVLVDQASETRWGGTVGTGIEIGFAPNWSVGFEYDHLFMGNRNITFTAPGGGFHPNRQYPPGRRHGQRPRQLSLGRPGGLEILS